MSQTAIAANAHFKSWRDPKQQCWQRKICKRTQALSCVSGLPWIIRCTCCAQQARELKLWTTPLGCYCAAREKLWWCNRSRWSLQKSPSPELPLTATADSRAVLNRQKKEVCRIIQALSCYTGLLLSRERENWWFCYRSRGSLQDAPQPWSASQVYYSYFQY